jgi:hypothetical protein
MVDMWRPITLTTITTIAGFVGISIMSIMPPIIMFGWIAALGVALAWVFSLFSLPNVLLLLDPKPSPAFRSWEHHEASRPGRVLAHIGSVSARNYKPVLIAVSWSQQILVAFGASRLQIDRAQVDNFAPDEPIRIADQTINDSFAGSAFLDVVMQTDEPEGFSMRGACARSPTAALLREPAPRSEDRGHHRLPDPAPRGHRGTAAGSRSAAQLPDSDDAIAQYLLVYEASGDPTDFEEEIDTEYRPRWCAACSMSSISAAIARRWLPWSVTWTQFNEPGMTALLTGDVNVSYHWMRSLQRSHFGGVLVSLGLVLVTSILVFRSVSAGLWPSCPSALPCCSCMPSWRPWISTSSPRRRCSRPSPSVSVSTSPFT